MSDAWSENVFDRPSEFATLLGGFWNTWFDDAEWCREYAAQLSHLWKDVSSIFDAALSRAGWKDIPLHEQSSWFPLFLDSRVRSSSPFALERFDSSAGHLYDGSLQWDVPLASNLVHRYPLPPGLVACHAVADALRSPQQAWSSGFDFFLDLSAREIVFFRDPLTLVSTEDIYDASGDVVGASAFVWLYRPFFDRRWIQKILGPVVRVEAESSEDYKTLLLAAMRSTTCGTSMKDIRELLEAATGIQLAKGYETVELVEQDFRGLVVVTDQEVYRFSSSSISLVSVGDLVSPGQALTSDLRLTEINRGQVPSSLAGLSLGPNYRGGDPGELVFLQQDVPVTAVWNDETRRVEVTFPLAGDEAAEARFWGLVRQRETAEMTLARCLDPLHREQPTTSAVPATIKPLQFLLENIFRGPVVICQILSSGIADNRGSRLAWLRTLEETVSPWGGVIVVLVVDFGQDDVSPPEDSFSVVGLLPSDDELDPGSLVAESLEFRVVQTDCQEDG